MLFLSDLMGTVVAAGIASCCSLSATTQGNSWKEGGFFFIKVTCAALSPTPFGCFVGENGVFSAKEFVRGDGS